MSSSLAGSDRDYFAEVSQAAFANPFSEERRQLDSRLAGMPMKESERAAKLKEAVSARIRKLEAAQKAHLKFYRGDAQLVMRNVFLFEIYHGYCQSLDELIARQLEAGDQPIAVKFAEEALGELARRGFTEAESLRYFGIFYQLRRAYYFIVHGLTGGSSCMEEFRRRVWNNVFTHNIQWYERYLWNRLEDFSTLLLGETGTGKGTAAAALGRSGFIPFDPARRRFVESFTRSFVSLNLSQYPDTLIESELFGHRKGAFTGAVDTHEGIFSRCSAHGSIFLDEIGDVSIPVQIKLLQVLQERAFSPVGSHAKLRFRGRVIGATNRPVDELRAEKLFRDDFFYRLCSDVITLPPLRQRLRESPAELDNLVRDVVARTVGEPAEELVAFARAELLHSVGEAYEWPGNVRELEQAVRRILVMRVYRPQQPRPANIAAELCARIAEGALDADALLSRYCRILYERFGSFEEVARRAGLDARTVKKYLRAATG